MTLTSLIERICNKDVKKIGFFGLGKSNRRIAEILLSEGWCYGFTKRSTKEDARGEALDVRRSYFGENSLSELCEDILFLSPSVRRSNELLRTAKNRGCTLCSDAELFFSSTPKNVLAITGSDGKSTVTYLTSRLTESTLGAPAAGNYGLPLCELIGKSHYKGATVELSSFQLTYTKPKVSRALITNITENHLNWHADFEEYIRAKKNVFENAELRAIVPDGEVCEGIAKEMHTDILISDRASAIELNRRYNPKMTVTRELGCICIDGIPYIPLKAIRCKEDYNILNFMCAIALSHGYSDKSAALTLAESFVGLPHRKEIFLKKHGVTYINSSIDSTPVRTANTLSTLKAKAIVIVGGASKGLSYAPLIAALRKHAKAVVLTGESAPVLLPLLEQNRELSRCVCLEPDFDRAAELAVKIADVGDTVILSPSHTSYDRFENFEVRGEHFKKIIKDITK